MKAIAGQLEANLGFSIPAPSLSLWRKHCL
jgi:hypothetical protein